MRERERGRKREEKTASLGARKLRERVRVWPKQTACAVGRRDRDRGALPFARSIVRRGDRLLYFLPSVFSCDCVNSLQKISDATFAERIAFDYSACQGKLFPCLAHVPSIATELERVRRAAVCDRFLSREISAISYGSESRVPRREIHSGRNWFGSDDTHRRQPGRRGGQEYEMRKKE